MLNPVSFDVYALKNEAKRLGFSDVSIARFDSLIKAKPYLDAWLAQAMQGSMHYMANHIKLRLDPTQLLPQAQSAFLLRMDYLHNPVMQIEASHQILTEPLTAHISFYAQGKDYHTVLRKQLKSLVQWLQIKAPQENFRVFTDSAPVMEVQLAQDSGLGWRGKHTLLLNRDAGSTFFLGGILTTLDLPAHNFTEQLSSHCGQCTRCIDICPTQAIVAPYIVDARRCISYLTIEHEGSIPIEFRPLMGNRIYGCDDCQTVCPWNKFAKSSAIADFKPRHQLNYIDLIQLWDWTEADFLNKLQGSAIRRIGHVRWLRNIATALGNALSSKLTNNSKDTIRCALQQHRYHDNEIVREHVQWALLQG